MSRAWQKLLEKSMRHQDEKLLTGEFLSVEEAAMALKVLPRTVERRLRNQTLLALRGHAVREPRIPAWALSFRPEVTKALQEVGCGDWYLYGFLQESVGGLGGLTPAQMFCQPKLLRRVPRAIREDVAERLAASGQTFISVVVKLLTERRDHTDGSGFG